MKFIKYISILTLVFGLVASGYAQSSGELTRFDNKALTLRAEVKLYPNPATDVLEVQIKNADNLNPTLTVHNIIGNVVDVAIEDLGNNEYRVNVENLSPGYYLLAVKDDNNMLKETYKFLKR